MPELAPDVTQQPPVVGREQFPNDVPQALGAFALGLRHGGEAGRFDLVQGLAAGAAFPERFPPQFRLEGFELAQEAPDRVVEGFDDVRAGFFGAQDVRGQPEGQAGGVKLLLRVPVQRDVQMNRARGKLAEMLFEFADFLVNLLPEQFVPVQVSGHQVPRQSDQLVSSFHRRISRGLPPGAASAPRGGRPGQRV